MEGAEDGKIKLVSHDQETIEVEKSVAIQSVLIKSMLEDAGEDEDIPVPNVSSAVLNKILEFCRHVRDTGPCPEIEKPLRSANIHDVIEKWYADYIDVDQEMLMEIMMAANYLDIRSLLELSCAKLASKLKGKTPQQLREEFHLENDFTPEEEAKLMEENKWALE
jgi:S-phase kinase-associated protein 1